MAAIEIWQGVVQGFSTGLGVGIANWLLIRRLEHLENKIQKKINGKTKKA